MARYVALFGSINVGGNRLKMADLRAAFEAEDFTSVETVVASGNVLFDYDDRPTRGLEEKLTIMVDERFEMTAAALVRSRDELAAAIADNPFAGQNADKFVHTMFLDAQPTAAQFDTLVADYKGRGDERMALGDRALFIDYGDGVGDSKLTGPFIERRLGCKGTARNMRSIARIVAKLDEEAKGTS